MKKLWIIFIVILIDCNDCWFMNMPSKLNICGDWLSYKNEKCVKVVLKLSTEDEAKIICNQMDRSSTLLTIESEEEQLFMNNVLHKYSNESDKVWLGVDIHKLVLNPWNRESMYTNWADGSADLIGYHSCVQMSLSKASLGKWSDEPCRRRGLTVCQRRQEWTIKTLRDILENMNHNINTTSDCENLIKQQNHLVERLEKFIETQTVVINEHNRTIELMNQTFEKRLLKIQKDLLILENITETKIFEESTVASNTIPLGFLYFQLPNQTAPKDLWPIYIWTDISDQYSGLFFRTVGGKAAPFGEIQNANHSRITNVMSTGLVDVTYTKIVGNRYVIDEGGWTTNLVLAKALSDLYIHQSEGENRPINTAIKIWIRS